MVWPTSNTILKITNGKDIFGGEYLLKVIKKAKVIDNKVIDTNADSTEMMVQLASGDKAHLVIEGSRLETIKKNSIEQQELKNQYDLRQREFTEFGASFTSTNTVPKVFLGAQTIQNRPTGVKIKTTIVEPQGAQILTKFILNTNTDRSIIRKAQKNRKFALQLKQQPEIQTIKDLVKQVFDKGEFSEKKLRDVIKREAQQKAQREANRRRAVEKAPVKPSEMFGFPARPSAPGSAKRAAPGSAKRAAPDGARRATPGSASRSEPGSAKRAAPGRARPSAPGSAKRAAPGSARRRAPPKKSARSRKDAGRKPVQRKMPQAATTAATNATKLLVNKSITKFSPKAPLPYFFVKNKNGISTFASVGELLKNTSKNISTTESNYLDTLILRYSIMLSMRALLEQQIRESRELLNFIEPYKCVAEFIAKLNLQVYEHPDTKAQYKNFESAVGCMKNLFDNSQLFDKGDAIVRYAGALEKTTKEIQPADEIATEFFSQMRHIIQNNKNRSVHQLVDAWTHQFGKNSIETASEEDARSATFSRRSLNNTDRLAEMQQHIEFDYLKRLPTTEQAKELLVKLKDSIKKSNKRADLTHLFDFFNLSSQVVPKPASDGYVYSLNDMKSAILGLKDDELILYMFKENRTTKRGRAKELKMLRDKFDKNHKDRQKQTRVRNQTGGKTIESIEGDLLGRQFFTAKGRYTYEENSNIIRQVYKKGFCYKDNQHRFDLKPDELAEAHVDVPFWRTRLAHFVNSLGFVDDKNFPVTIDLTSDTFMEAFNKLLNKNFNANYGKLKNWMKTNNATKKVKNNGEVWNKEHMQGYKSGVEHCAEQEMKYCPGMLEMTKSMLKYRIPRGQGTRFTGDFKKLIVDMKAIVKNIKFHQVEEGGVQKQKGAINKGKHFLKQIDNYLEKQLEQPLLVWRNLSLLDRDTVIRESANISVQNLKPREMISVIYKGKTDYAVVVPLHDNQSITISYNALKKVESNNVLNRIPADLKEQIYQDNKLALVTPIRTGFGIRARGGSRPADFDEAFSEANKKRISKSTQGLRQVLKHMASALDNLRIRIQRRHARKKEETSRKFRNFD